MSPRYTEDAEYDSLCHGKYATYANRGCRCDDCREAKRQYDRKRRGSILTAAERYAPATDRVAMRLRVDPSGCHVYAGPTNASGYGILGRGKAMGGGMALAHRVAYEAAYGPIPDGLVVCHRCDNPPCCNPEHLFAGTLAENNADRDSKHCGIRGERVHFARLREVDIPEIRRLRSEGHSLREIASKFGVTDSTIHAVVSRQTWKHVQDQEAS
jgi:hypothetical protein